MATIIRFSIPECVINVIDTERFDTSVICRNVQSELNMGTVTKSSSKRNNDWKTEKTEDGGEKMVIVKKSKAGETLKCENTIGNRFDAWCQTMVTLQSFGATEFSLPDCYLSWFIRTATRPEWLKKQEEIKREEERKAKGEVK